MSAVTPCCTVGSAGATLTSWASLQHHLSLIQSIWFTAQFEAPIWRTILLHESPCILRLKQNSENGVQLLLHTRHARNSAASSTSAAAKEMSSIYHKPQSRTQPVMRLSHASRHARQLSLLSIRAGRASGQGFQYAYHDAIRTNRSIYQVQYVNHGAGSVTLKSYAVHRLAISCGDRWPPKEHPLALRKVNYLSRQVALEETQKVFALLDRYIELCDPKNERATQIEWALPFLEVASSKRIELISENKGEWLAGRPQVQWLDDSWIERQNRKNVVRCRQVAWSRAWDEEEWSGVMC